MMFTDFSKAVHAKFLTMSQSELYVTYIHEHIFDNYLLYFPPGTNPIFRQRTVYDCQCCKNFVQRLGALVVIKDGKLITVWDDLSIPEPFKTVAEKMGLMLRQAKIKCVFRTKKRKYGNEYNYNNVTNERHDHFYGEVADRHFSKTPETLRGEKDGIFQVMKRGLVEISHMDLVTVIDLIDNNGLYRGEEHRAAVQGFWELQNRFHEAGQTDLFVWENLDNRNSRFRNTVIGTLLVDLAEGKDLEDAVKAFEVKVAPMNYKRPTAIITQRMVADAVQTLTDLGLHGALARRYARLTDISVNDVLFVDNDSKGKMKDSVTTLLESSVKVTKPNVTKTVTVTSEEFLKTVLPTVKSLQVLIENRHTGNFLSLTGGDGPERLFKWNNNFAWSYDGNVTDSVKQRVKAAGGNIDAKLRVSLSWFNTDDLDLHCHTPDGDHIYFRDKMDILDVDMNAISHTRTAVENLAFQHLTDGVYQIYVHQFRQRETSDIGFAIEVEYGGVINQYSYGKAVRGEVPCFNLLVKDQKLMKIDTDLVGGTTSLDKWGVKTETLVPVVAVFNSPNHWSGQGVGAKHLIFALKDCRNPAGTRGIYNEFLRGDLDKHRKVFEILGAKTQCSYSEEQVSGLGFTASRGDTVTVVVDGKRSYTLKF